MPSWREMAAGAANSAIEPQGCMEQPRALDLPPALAAAVLRLPDLPSPVVTQPEAWREVCADAVRLAEEGWASKALALGWSEYDVFGIGERSSADFEGLAVWLAGRRVRVLSEWTALTECGATFYREEFGRARSPRLPSVFLWQFGRRR